MSTLRNISVDPGAVCPEELFDKDGNRVQVLGNPCPEAADERPDPILPDPRPVIGGADIGALLRLPRGSLEHDTSTGVAAMVDLPRSMRARSVETLDGWVIDAAGDAPADPRQAAFVLPSRLDAGGSGQFGPFSVTLPEQQVRDLFDSDELGAALIVFPLETPGS